MADAKRSDLPVRAASAVAMVAVAGAAMCLGGWFWTIFVTAVALGVLWEWWGLVKGFEPRAAVRAIWMVGGLIYVGLAAFMFAVLRFDPPTGWPMLMMVLFGVVFTDVGAYFTGRTFGGPKIAPKISPSKTWSGLAGGILGAAAGIYVALLIASGDWFTALVNEAARLGPDDMTVVSMNNRPSVLGCLVLGAVVAVVAQTGDFFESWMKRRAGVKDSSKLIPGHGGLFDRADGMLAVMFVVGLLAFFNSTARS
ncbi:MAG: phosphatidate cytidylyltransferase [Novosphingobium sp.]